MADDRIRPEDLAGERADLERYLRRRTPVPEDARDGAAAAIAEACATTGIRDRAHLRPWLRTVGARRTVDEYRARRLPARAAFLLDPATAPAADEALLDRELAREVAALVGALPADQRDALLAQADGQSTVQIAAVMRRSPRSVEGLLHRGRRAVLAALSGGLTPLVRPWRQLRARLRVLLAAGTAAAITVAGLGLGDTLLRDPRTAPGQRAGAAVSGASLRHGSTARRPRPVPSTERPSARRPLAASGRAAPLRLSRSAPRTWHPTSPQDLDVDQLGHHAGVHGGGTSREGGGSGDGGDGDAVSGFLADVQTCLDHGVDVSPDKVSCRPDDEGGAE
jgi:DNA-directed RNA polymerase specialized sigma24 family protein